MLCAATVRNFINYWGAHADCVSVPDLVNDTYACENDRTLNQILKGEIGFQGYVVTDWVAQRSTLAAVAGLDVSIPCMDVARSI